MEGAKPLDTELGKTVIVPPATQKLVQVENNLMNTFPTRPAGQLPHDTTGKRLMIDFEKEEQFKNTNLNIPTIKNFENDKEIERSPMDRSVRNWLE